jgi:hypothetical protein
LIVIIVDCIETAMDGKLLLQRLCRGARSASMSMILATAVSGSPIPAQPPERDAVIKTVSDALYQGETGDFDGFAMHLAPSFYMYDRGKRYDAAQLIDGLQQLRRGNTHLHWSVTMPDVHIHGDTAWIAYINDGSMTTTEKSTRRKWLESAFLVKTSGEWKVEFWHSTPVPEQ